jgi:hypothetical protein
MDLNDCQPRRFLAAEDGPMPVGQGFGEQHGHLDGKVISTSAGIETPILRSCSLYPVHYTD